MNHAIIDVTGEEVKLGDEVIILNTLPMYVNSNIRREYI